MSNSVNFYEFIGFITFYIEMHELVYVYSFLVSGFLVFFKKPKKPKFF